MAMTKWYRHAVLLSARRCSSLSNFKRLALAVVCLSLAVLAPCGHDCSARKNPVGTPTQEGSLLVATREAPDADEQSADDITRSRTTMRWNRSPKAPTARPTWPRPSTKTAARRDVERQSDQGRPIAAGGSRRTKQMRRGPAVETTTVAGRVGQISGHHGRRIDQAGAD